MTLPNGRTGRLIALALLVVFVVLGYAATVLPLERLYRARAEEVADKQDELARLQRIAAEVPALKARLAVLRDNAKKTQLLLGGPSDAVAAADLQGKLKDLIAQAGAEMTSAEGVTAVSSGAFRRVGVRVVVVGDLEMLTATLSAIQRSRPPLFVDDLEVRNNTMSPVKTPGKSPALSIAFNVYGYRATTAKQASATP